MLHSVSENRLINRSYFYLPKQELITLAKVSTNNAGYQKSCAAHQAGHHNYYFSSTWPECQRASKVISSFIIFAVFDVSFRCYKL